MSIKAANTYERIDTKNYELVNKKTKKIREFPEHSELSLKTPNEYTEDVKFTSYVYLNTDAFKELFGERIPTELIALILFLVPFLENGTNYVLFTRSKPMDTKILGDLLNQDSKHVRKKIRKLIDIGVLKEKKVDVFKRKVFVFSPYIVRNGKKILVSTVKLFK